MENIDLITKVSLFKVLLELLREVQKDEKIPSEERVRAFEAAVGLWKQINSELHELYKQAKDEYISWRMEQVKL